MQDEKMIKYDRPILVLALLIVDDRKVQARLKAIAVEVILSDDAPPRIDEDSKIVSPPSSHCVDQPTAPDTSPSLQIQPYPTVQMLKPTLPTCTAANFDSVVDAFDAMCQRVPLDSAQLDDEAAHVRLTAQPSL